MAKISTDLNPSPIPIKLSVMANKLMKIEAKKKAIAHSQLLRSWIEEYCRWHWPDQYLDETEEGEVCSNG